MVRGIGIDLIEKDRFVRLHQKYGKRLAHKILSSDERDELDKIADKPSFLSKRFAAKEALSKAIGTGLYRQGIYPSLITIKHDQYGKPFFKFDHSLITYMERNFVNIQLSITDSDDESIAFVITE